MRYNVAQQLYMMCVALGPDTSRYGGRAEGQHCQEKRAWVLSAGVLLDRADIVPPFLKLLRDSEAEVRVAAAGKVACIGNILEADTVGSHACHSFAPLPSHTQLSLVWTPAAGHQAGPALCQGAGC